MTEPMRKASALIKGSSLIEVLISLLILAFGLLGMAGLQTLSLRNNQSAYYRTQASIMAADIIELMRANIEGVEAGNYDNTGGSATASCFTLVGCTPAQMAAQDVFTWQAAVQTALPGGDSVVCRDATAEDGTAIAKACDGSGNIYAIKIWWDDNRDGVANQRYVLSFRPQ